MKALAALVSSVAALLGFGPRRMTLPQPPDDGPRANVRFFGGGFNARTPVTMNRAQRRAWRARRAARA